ncbi:MAG TPA: hypothetical protein VIB48_13495 [Acidimicrobiia bacterium]|jgi:hypothetical protein
MADDRIAQVAEPLVTRLERDGAGSAAFDWPQVLSALTGGLRGRVESVLGKDVDVLGVRFLDADGREAAGPVPSGTTIVAFTSGTE